MYKFLFVKSAALKGEDGKQLKNWEGFQHFFRYVQKRLFSQKSYENLWAHSVHL